MSEEELAPEGFNSVFKHVDLTQEEELKGQLLTPENILVLQNERAKIAEQKVRMTFDACNVERYMQTEAMLAGQLQILDLLLANGAMAKDILSGKIKLQPQQ